MIDYLSRIVKCIVLLKYLLSLFHNLPSIWFHLLIDDGNSFLSNNKTLFKTSLPSHVYKQHLIKHFSWYQGASQVTSLLSFRAHTFRRFTAMKQGPRVNKTYHWYTRNGTGRFYGIDVLYRVSLSHFPSIVLRCFVTLKGSVVRWCLSKMPNDVMETLEALFFLITCNVVENGDHLR